MFQKRHYEALAERIRTHHPKQFIGASHSKSVLIANVVAGLVTDLANMLEKDNPGFKREMFIRKCGWH